MNITCNDVVKDDLRVTEFLSHAAAKASIIGLDRSAPENRYRAWRELNSANQSNTSDCACANSSYWTNAQLAEYVYTYYTYFLIQYHVNIAVGITSLVIVLAGVFGYVSTVFVLRCPQFSAPTYLYHKALVCVESVNTLSLIIACLSKFLLSTSASLGFCYLVTNVCFTVQQVIALSADLITLVMSLERVVALCFATSYFRVNRREVALSLIAVAILPGLLHAPSFNRFRCEIQEGHVKNGYSDFYKRFSKSGYVRFVTAVENVKTFASIIACTVVVAGAIRWRRNCSRLLTGLTSSTATRDQIRLERQKMRMTHQLTLLCLGISIPSTMYSIHVVLNLEFFTHKMGHLMSQNPGPDLSFATANWAVKFLGVANQTNLFLQTFWFCIAHTSHFYLYCAFCKSFRKQTAKVLRLDRVTFGNFRLQTHGNIRVAPTEEKTFDSSSTTGAMLTKPENNN